MKKPCCHWNVFYVPIVSPRVYLLPVVNFMVLCLSSVLSDICKCHSDLGRIRTFASNLCMNLTLRCWKFCIRVYARCYVFISQRNPGFANIGHELNVMNSRSHTVVILGSAHMYNTNGISEICIFLISNSSGGRTRKSKVFPVFIYVPRTEDVWGCRGIAPRILNLDTRWR
jgi:hypothetical protein